MTTIRHLLSTALLATAALAQTTGVPGINDYTVNGLGSGATSCSSMCFPNGGVTLNLAVSAPAGSVVLVLFNFCPCTTCSIPAPTNSCLPSIPLTACGGSNQSLDMSMVAACGIAFTAVMTTNTAGTLSMPLTIPPIAGVPCASAVLSTQAVVLNTCGLGLVGVPGPFVMTQSFTLLF